MHVMPTGLTLYQLGYLPYSYLPVSGGTVAKLGGPWQPHYEVASQVLQKKTARRGKEDNTGLIGEFFFFLKKGG